MVDRVEGVWPMSAQRPEMAPQVGESLPDLTDRQSAADLLPHVYAELRRLANVLSGGLETGQTPHPTAPWHEAFIRLVRGKDPGGEGRRHFFGAAAGAMREILIEQARHKATVKRGGEYKR